MEIRFPGGESRGLCIYPGGHVAWLHEYHEPVSHFDRETYRAPDGIGDEASPFQAVALSPDGLHCALAGGDSFGSRQARISRCCIIVVDARNGSERRRLYGMTEVVNSLAWSSDGKHLAAGTWDRGLHLFDASSGTLLASKKPTQHRYEPSTGKGSSRILSQVSSVAFLDDRLLASAGGTRVVLWKVPDLKPLTTLEEGEQEVTHLAASPDGQWLAVISSPSAFGDIEPQHNDGELRLWEVGARAVHCSSTGSFLGVVFTPDSKRLATLVGYDGPNPPFEPYPPRGAARVPYTSPLYRKQLMLLELSSFGALWCRKASGNPQRLAFSEAGDVLFAVGVEKGKVVLRSYDPANGKPLVMETHAARKVEGEHCTGASAAGGVVAAVTEDAVRVFRSK
jgi:dipeptidyl aminopeptidase/acylaminoacyl peptidase